jgi:mannose-6-phosphate isomerase-like protein (cupin superfamily)
MAPGLPPIRRFITGWGENGRSKIIENEAMEGKTLPERPGFRMANIWATTATPAPIKAPEETGKLFGVHPPKNGTVIRVMDIPPQPKQAEASKAQHSVTRHQMFPDAIRDKGDTSKHPGMHMTDTVDYAILIEGEIWAIMEDEEVLMKAGDVLVQRGTVHAWANRSDKMARICFVLIDGKWE